jgi:CRISPR-associated exonuclease Cas4
MKDDVLFSLPGKEKEDYLLLSQLTQAGYCLRRVGLVMNEQLWEESSDTAKGHQEHERTHTQRVERRGNSLTLYEYDVWSDELGVLGKCDCIEAKGEEGGCWIPGCEFPVRLYPVEYKHGKVRSEEEYNVQLCAQAMCLEEMYHTEIPEGALFYVSSHRRYPVKLDEPLREKVRETVRILRQLRDSFQVPKAEYSAKCMKCSLKQLCMPKLNQSAAQYCKRLEQEAQEVEKL